MRCLSVLDYSLIKNAVTNLSFLFAEYHWLATWRIVIVTTRGRTEKLTNSRRHFDEPANRRKRSRFGYLQY